MRKFLISLLIVLAIPMICFAADSSRAAAVGGKVDQIIAIGDGSSGYLAEVSSGSGALNTAGRAQAVTSQTGDALVYTGACRVQSIQVRVVNAADYILVYDALTATGTPKFDITVATANDSQGIYVGGAPFATGIYVDAGNTTVFSSITYDY
jgi:hypothetical protein